MAEFGLNLAIRANGIQPAYKFGEAPNGRLHVFRDVVRTRLNTGKG
jgi:hypothetical protein